MRRRTAVRMCRWAGLAKPGKSGKAWPHNHCAHPHGALLLLVCCCWCVADAPTQHTGTVHCCWRTCPEDDYVPVLKVADGPAPDVGLSNLTHLNGCLHPRRQSKVLNSSLQHDTAQHATSPEASAQEASHAEGWGWGLTGQYRQTARLLPNTVVGSAPRQGWLYS